MNGSWLIAGCFRFIFGSRYAESTRSKFGVSAYSQINMVRAILNVKFSIAYCLCIVNPWFFLLVGLCILQQT